VMLRGGLVGKTVRRKLESRQGESQEEPMAWHDASKK
jgi:hypothetical protein